jgi:hypothetical protein
MADDSNGNGRRVNFSNVISLGNALIILAMLASAGGTLMVVGRELQGIMDDEKQMHSDLLHETEMRIAGQKAESDARLQTETALINRLADMTNQENRDMQSVNQTLMSMRDDYRDLLRIAGQPAAVGRH